ncbi:NAD(P)-binding domain-containing protein [Stenotrophomonas terrae]|nr:NAD(P)-binding domain-containing protein [Stenotrophomonas terrae]
MIAIIGGGPAGIALGLELDKRSIAYDLFEARQLASTWRSVPSGLHVLSPWWTNVLQFRHALAGNPLRKPRAEVYLAHLDAMARRLKGQLFTDCRVDGLRPDGSGRWVLDTAQGRRGPYSTVVLATGYFSTPRPADPLINTDGSLPMVHAAEVTDYAALEAMRDGDLPVVVVGRRVTAGQLLLELEARDIPVALSTRSAMEYRRHGVWASIRETAYFFWEELQARLIPNLRRPSYPVMEGGPTESLVASGKVAVLPRIRSIVEGALLLDDGRKVRAAAVILATGYHPGLGLLPDSLDMDEYGIPSSQDFQISAMPGVHLLGFDNVYDHRSRYLRGIRADAGRLADLLVVKRGGVGPK